MKTFILLLGLIFAANVQANDILDDVNSDVKAVTNKVVKTSWIKDRSLHWGLIITSVMSGASTGLIESAKFGGFHISNSADDYHAYRMVQDISNVSYGWMLYAQTQQRSKSFWVKSGRIIESLCWRRNAFELTYRANVTGSPFNYSDKYSSNKKAIVYFKWDGDKGKFVDAYVRGTGKQGAFIDLGFTTIAVLLHSLTN